ncbi:unnamed protein product [Bursaphelenchus xylophilus]|uniref:(pine wood nematode) hypothetical protein n=1 Tax=Bursaphelenchus xylophilus TaxID=6326 RepID=A0A1I7RNP6_BURXY|nr:unnamed protein product [Bursaphelenchus xylophilus]CAG9124204.1 unnamed protein product [Bursaphelenchus xylophilus]
MMTLWVIFLIGHVFPIFLACQPPLQYTSNAVYGSKTYEVPAAQPQLLSQGVQSAFVQDPNYSDYKPNAHVPEPSFNVNGVPSFSIEHSVEVDDGKASNSLQPEFKSPDDISSLDETQKRQNLEVERQINDAVELHVFEENGLNPSNHPPSDPPEPNQLQSKDLSRPENPFPEHRNLAEWARICSRKEPAGFMEILDCTEVDSFNEDQNLADPRYSSCNFDENSRCRFYGNNEEELVFRRGAFVHHKNGSVFGPFEESFSVLTKRPLGALPQDGFLVMAEPFGNTPDAAGIIQMEVKCQKGDGVLSFDYWTTEPNVEVKVCTRVDDDRRCTTNIEYVPDSSRVDIQVIHTDSENFLVEVIVSGFKKPGLFIMDNLVYEAQDCLSKEFSSNRPNHLDSPVKSSESDVLKDRTPPSLQIPSLLIDRNSGAGSSLRIRQLNSNPCKAIECSFEKDLCGYSQSVLDDDVNHGKWQFSRSRIGNINTESNTKSNHSGFAYVGVDDRGVNTKGRTVYILESEEFNLPAEAELRFAIYKQSNAISLQVCIDSLANCPYEAPPIKAHWRENETVVLPSGTKKIFFVATQWKRFKWLGIDEIRLDFDCHETH